jgi:hypothetical protein
VSAPDWQIANALAKVIEPAPGTETDFLDVYGAARKYLADTYSTNAPIRDVKRILRAAGIRTRTPVANEVQWAVDVRIVPANRPLSLEDKLRNLRRFN